MVQNNRSVVGCCIATVGLPLLLPALRVMVLCTMGLPVDALGPDIHGRSYVMCKDSNVGDSRSYGRFEQEVALKVVRMYRWELHYEREELRCLSMVDNCRVMLCYGSPEKRDAGHGIAEVLLQCCHKIMIVFVGLVEPKVGPREAPRKACSALCSWLLEFVHRRGSSRYHKWTELWMRMPSNNHPKMVAPPQQKREPRSLDEAIDFPSGENKGKCVTAKALRLHARYY